MKRVRISNRRNESRQALMMKINYTCGKDFITDYSTNISRGGIFLNTKKEFANGERVHLEFTLPGYEEPLKAIGKVVWATPLQKKKKAKLLPGVGIQFQHMSDSHRRVLHDFLEIFHIDNDSIVTDTPAALTQKSSKWEPVKNLYKQNTERQINL